MICYWYSAPDAMRPAMQMMYLIRNVTLSPAETKFRQPRPNGSHVQHLRNSCVLLSEKGAPLGNRIKGCLGFEFNKPRWRKLGLLSKRLY